MKFLFTVPYVFTGAVIFAGGHASQYTVNDLNGGVHMHIPVKTKIDTLRPMTATAPTPIEIISEGKNVAYIFNNGDTIRRIGGSRAWRNNNPGNLRYTPFAREMGAIGEAGKFAVFPDEESGMRALDSLLRAPSYAQSTINRAITKYAPPVQNDVAAYTRKIQRLTGISPNKRLQELDSMARQSVLHAIKVIEGWTPGTEIVAAKPRPKRRPGEQYRELANKMIYMAAMRDNTRTI